MSGMRKRTTLRLDLKYAAEICLYIRLKVPLADVGRFHAVRVRLSPLCGVSCEGLRAAFRQFAEAEGFLHLALEIVPLPCTVYCKKCGTRSSCFDGVRQCPGCSSEDLVIERGDDFAIDGVF